MASPSARRLAAEFGLNLADIPGSGPGGRIIERDIMAQKEQRQTLASPLARKVAREEGLALSGIQGSGVHGKIMRKDVEGRLQVQGGPTPADELLPFTGIRKIIAERMEQSAFSAPHVTLFKEVDVGNLMAARDRVRKAEPALQSLTYTVFIAAMAARALTEFPEVNSRIEGDHIRRMAQVHVGLAVALDQGLVVPVLHHTPELSLQALAAKAKALIAKARAGSLLVEEMQGGTFTVSNLGSFGIDGFTPIINPPESAILGLGRIIEKPVVMEGQVVVRPMMMLSLSFDHRVVDGAPAARFLNRIADYIHEPLLLL
jgi:pyruvate dehydrogenase E2 component (dihydrolipoamide acetyltransferase)